MDPNQNEGQGSGFVNKANNVGRLAYDNTRRFKGAYRAIKTLRITTAAGGIWWVPIIFALCFALGLTLFISMSVEGGVGGGSGVGEGGDLSSPPPSESGTTTPTCSQGNYSDCLLSQFNVTVIGTTDQTTLRLIYDALSIPMAYPLFSQRFKAARVTISINSAQTGFNGGWLVTNQAGDIAIYQKFFEAADRTKKEYLIHEAGHSVGNTNDQLQQNFYKSVYKAGLDPKCYLQGVIKTYALGLINSNTRLPNEAFAEAVADSVLCNNTGICPKNSPSGFDIPNFPSTCLSTYTWIKNNVLGG